MTVTLKVTVNLKIMPYARKDAIAWASGEYYHLYNRGANRRRIFRGRENYLFVLGLMKRYREELDIGIIAYCLMPNHYHFLVRQDGAEDAGLLPQRVFNSYTKAFNKQHSLSGTLFEARYRACRVDGESYLRQLCRYIHANPVKAGLVSGPEEWPYSNYLEWVGERPGSLYDRRFVEEMFTDAATYREFVNDYVSLLRLPDELGYLARFD